MSTCSLRTALTVILGGLLMALVLPARSSLADFQVGAASVDITPNKAVALWGQFGLRLSTEARYAADSQCDRARVGRRADHLRIAGPATVSGSLRPGDQ